MDTFEHLGKRYFFADDSAPDVTVVSIDSMTVRLHAIGGTRQTMPSRLFLQAINQGALVESTALPFTNPKPFVPKGWNPWRAKTSPVAVTSKATARRSTAARAR